MHHFKMKNIVISILLLAGIAAAQSSSSNTISKVGTTVGQFLKIQPSARTVSMGGAFIAVANDVSTMYGNPAGLSRMNTSEAMFSHVDWVVDTNYDFLALGINIYSVGTVGLMISTFGSGDMPVYTVEQPEGTGELFDTRDFMVGLSYARNLSEDFSIGFNAKYINSRIWHMSSSTIALDLGTLFTTPFWDLQLGASISNFGPKMKLSGRDVKYSFDPDPLNTGNVEFVNSEYELNYFELPLMFKVGISRQFSMGEMGVVTLAVDAIHPNDNYESVNTGMEYAWQDAVFIRAGYHSLFLSDSEQGPSFGLGTQIRLAGTIKLTADYAYADFGRLENAQRFTLAVKF